MHSGEGIQGCSIYTGIAGVAYMFLRLAESMQYTQQKMTDHPDQFFANLDAACLLNRAEEYGHWAKHLSNCGKHEKTAIASLRVIAPDRSLSHGVPEKMPAAECEILYGRCGYLHALLIRRKYAGPTPETQQLSRSRMWRRVKGGATQLRSMGDTHWDLMWSWHGSYYLGGMCNGVMAPRVSFQFLLNAYQLLDD
ncbi:TPA: hypothetical protein ACH3X3_001876 [Trebouxia sp. C0006]